MEGHQILTLDQVQTVGGVNVLNDMFRKLFDKGQTVAFIYSLTASTSADAYAKWGETQGTSTIGLRMPCNGSIIANSGQLNITTATSGDVTIETRINDTNQSDLELEFGSALGTGVAGKCSRVQRHGVTFGQDDIVQIHLNLTGTMTWETVTGFIEVIFDH